MAEVAMKAMIIFAASVHRSSSNIVSIVRSVILAATCQLFGSTTHCASSSCAPARCHHTYHLLRHKPQCGCCQSRRPREAASGPGPQRQTAIQSGHTPLLPPMTPPWTPPGPQRPAVQHAPAIASVSISSAPRIPPFHPLHLEQNREARIARVACLVDKVCMLPQLLMIFLLRPPRAGHSMGTCTS